MTELRWLSASEWRHDGEIQVRVVLLVTMNEDKRHCGKLMMVVADSNLEGDVRSCLYNGRRPLLHIRVKEWQEWSLMTGPMRNEGSRSGLEWRLQIWTRMEAPDQNEGTTRMEANDWSDDDWSARTGDSLRA